MKFHMKNYLRKILISGGNGQLANAIISRANETFFEVIACSHQQLDVTNIFSIQHVLENVKPDIIVNAAAYTAVDDAEINSDIAIQVNYDGTKNLAQLCNQHKIPIIHISTDYIFDGEKTLPYTESDSPNPINTYGLSKLLGEKALQDYHDQYIILRVSGVFSEYKNNFLKTILRIANEKAEIKVVNNQISCPTYAQDIADTIFLLIKNMHTYGIYHYCNYSSVSWFDFASEILSICKEYNYFLNTIITPIMSKDYKTLAKRPLYSVLDCAKIKRDYDIGQSHWQNNIRAIIKKLLVDKGH